MSEPESMHLSADELRLAKIFKALGSPVRLSILKRMVDCQPCMCGSIVEQLPLAQSTVSQHLKVLREAGLIVGEVDGPAVCYCLNLNTLAWLRQKVQAMPWYDLFAANDQTLIQIHDR